MDVRIVETSLRVKWYDEKFSLVFFGGVLHASSQESTAAQSSDALQARGIRVSIHDARCRPDRHGHVAVNSRAEANW